MFADTDAIRALGSANSAHADDLAHIAATLWSLDAMAGSALGPVAERFLSALTAAAEEGSRAVLALSDRLAGSRATAYAAAAAYDDADHSAGARITEV